MFPFLMIPLALALGVATHHPVTPAQRATTDSAAVTQRDAPVTIQFDNQAWDMATVYAVPQNGMAVRLGQVNAGSTARLVVPRSAVTSSGVINIVAVPFARRFSTGSGPVAVAPGDALKATLSPTENGVWVVPAAR